MNKLTILFLTMLLTCLPMAMRAESHKEKRDDTRYLAGAVPVVDGKVVFSKEFQIGSHFTPAPCHWTALGSIIRSLLPANRAVAW